MQSASSPISVSNFAVRGAIAYWITIFLCVLLPWIALGQSGSQPVATASYSMASNPNGQLLDSSGNSYNGTLSNFNTNPVFGTGPQANTSCLNFGATSSATIPFPVSAVNYGSISFSTWFCSTSSTGAATLATGSDTQGNSWSLGLNQNGVAVLTLASAQGAAQTITSSSPASLFDGTWHQIIFSVTASTATLYVDSVTTEGPVQWNAGVASNLVFGQTNNQSTNPSFSLGPTSLYGSALTSDQVTQLETISSSSSSASSSTA